MTKKLVLEDDESNTNDYFIVMPEVLTSYGIPQVSFNEEGNVYYVMYGIKRDGKAKCAWT